MKDNSLSRSERLTARISVISTVLIIVTLIIFLLISVFSIKKLNSKIKMLTERPYVITRSVGAITTNVELMRIRTERLKDSSTKEDVNIVKEALLVLYKHTEPMITSIKGLYSGNKEDTQSLEASFQRAKTEHEELMEKAIGYTSDDVTEFIQKNLDPLYNNMLGSLENILNFETQIQMEVTTSAEKLQQTTLITSIIMTVMCILGLVSYQIFLKLANKQIIKKNEQFETLSSSIDEAFIIFDNNNKSCEYVSNNAQRVLGISGESIKDNSDVLYENMDIADSEKIVEQLLNYTANTSKSLTVKYINPTTKKECWLVLKIYQNLVNGIIKQIVTVEDDTENVIAHRALQDALVNANNANNAKRDFLSRMSHEIRTPMNAIIGMTTIAGACISDTARVENCLGKISYASKHLLMLINDILDTSRIESNKLTLDNEPFDIYQFINNFVPLVLSQADIKKIEFVENIVGFDANSVYIGDALRLNQILLNLTSNAIKFTGVGGKVTLEVKRIVSEHGAECISFSVTDNGIGMSEESLSRIYDPFEQADASIAKKYGGSGLGMSIAKNLVTLMGGFIDIKSKLGEGTSVVVEIPFERSQTINNMPSANVDTLHVLVVDDQIDMCEHTMLLMKKINIRAKFTLSGKEAVELVVDAKENRDSFDVCFIDWKMPDMDGVETTRQIRKRVGGDTPIIIISAYDWADIEVEAREAGANAFIAKPLFLSSIYNVLVSVTHGNFGRASGEVLSDNSLKDKVILIAEDNELNLEIAEELLKMNGAIVECAHDGKEALEMFIASSPDHYTAILMDVQMPVMNGYESTENIRKLERADAKTIPIIATTANAFTEDMSAALASGMNAHITKPIDIKKICEIVNKLSAHNS